MSRNLNGGARTLIVIASLLDASSAANAQVAHSPSCQGEFFRAFDFWIGEWEVIDARGERAGESTITLEEQGCLLVERWRSVRGGRGQSFNFVDRATGKWRQVFVSSWGMKDYQGAPDGEGRMRLEGVVGYAEGGTAPFRGTWTPNPDGTVTQFLEEYDGETKVWSEWFTGIYRRVASGADPTSPIHSDAQPFHSSSLERCDGHDHGSGRFWRRLTRERD